MGQILRSKEFGEVEFDKTFVGNGLHLGKLTGGGYAHISGHPINSKDELLAAIGPGKDRDEAIHWWLNKDALSEKPPERRIVVNPNGDYEFDDGDPITSAQDLIGYFGSGDALEQALRWFAKELMKREQLEKETADLLEGKGAQVGQQKAKKEKKMTVADKLKQKAEAAALAEPEPEMTIKD